MEDAVEWLIGGEPFVEYRARIDLLGQPESAPEVIDAKRRLVTDQKIQLLLQEQPALTVFTWNRLVIPTL